MHHNTSRVSVRARVHNWTVKFMQALLGPMISSPFRYEELDAFVAFSTLLKFLHRLLAAALTFRAVEVCLIGTI